MRLMMFLLAFIIVIIASAVSAYHYNMNYNKAYYIQPNEQTFIFSGERTFGYQQYSYAMPMHRFRFTEESYPRYVHNRKSGKVYYVDDTYSYPLYSMMPLYQSFSEPCYYPLLSC